jgi:aspartate 1-decarboxylase
LTRDALSEEVAKKMDYLDFEIEIGIGEGRIYPVAVVRSAAGEAREAMRFPFDELALENQLLALQNALLRSGGKHRQILLPEEQTVQKFGRALFNALFSGEVGKRYAVSQLAALSQGKGLRLKLRILSPELAALPWEFLYDPGGSEYLCLSSTTPIVRYLELAQPPQPLLVTPPLSILGVVSSPKDLPQLDIEREKQRLEKAIEDLRANGLVELTWLPGQTWYHLQRAMRRGPWHILHFIGHGGFDAHTEEGLIALENEEGKAHRLSATLLGRLLADHRFLHLVVLNSCEGARGSEHDVFSSTATMLVRRGIPAVLAMQYAITDRAAIELSRAFYEALADGLPVDTAVSEARKAISFGITNTLEWGTPVLYMRSSDGVLFEMKQQPSRSHEPADRPATKQVPSLHAVASTEMPQSKPMQYEASSRISRKASEQEKQSADETFPTAQASSKIDALPPSRLEATSPDMKQCPACGAELQPRGAFCSSCGHRLVQIAHIPQTTSSAEERVPLPPMDKSPGRKIDATSTGQAVQAEEPSTVPSVLVTKAEEFALVDTLVTGHTDHMGSVLSVAISPDGHTLVSGSDDKTIKVWNLQSGKLLRTLAGHGGVVFSVAISPDGHTLVSGSGDKTIKVWNLQNGELLRTLAGHGDRVRSVAISPDGHTLVSGSGDLTIWVWNLQSGELLRALAGHGGWIDKRVLVAISPDGHTLVSGSGDKTIKVWNLQNGELLHTFTGHTGSVYSVAISPDGHTLVSGSDDKTIKVWSKK